MWRFGVFLLGIDGIYSKEEVMRSSSYRRKAALGFLALFLLTFFILSTPGAFAREAGSPTVSFKKHTTTLDADRVEHYGIADTDNPVGGDKEDDCNWLCRLLRFIGTAAQIAIDVMVLICKYNPRYCVI